MNFEKIVDELHDKAMGLTDLGFVSKQHGKQQEANTYFSQACKYEEKAAIIAQEHSLGQPTIGTLFISAATLASDAGDVIKMLNLTKRAISTHLSAKQQQDFLELLYGHNIYLRHLSESKISTIISEWAMVKLKKRIAEANAKIKRTKLSKQDYQSIVLEKERKTVVNV